MHLKIHLVQWLFEIFEKSLPLLKNKLYIYRLSTGEPNGVCVGFKPSEKALQFLNAEIDEWDLVEDDGSTENSHGCPVSVWLTDTANDVAIADISYDESVKRGWSPLGPDLFIWRSESEMLKHMSEFVDEGE